MSITQLCKALHKSEAAALQLSATSLHPQVAGWLAWVESSIASIEQRWSSDWHLLVLLEHHHLRLAEAPSHKLQESLHTSIIVTHFYNRQKLAISSSTAAIHGHGQPHCIGYRCRVYDFETSSVKVKISRGMSASNFI